MLLKPPSIMSVILCNLQNDMRVKIAFRRPMRIVNEEAKANNVVSIDSLEKEAELSRVKNTMEVSLFFADCK